MDESAVMRYEVNFERIGRNRNITPQVFEVSSGEIHPDHADHLAAAIYDFARRHLASRGYTVWVDIDKGTGSIEAGRYGRFTIQLLQTREHDVSR